MTILLWIFTAILAFMFLMAGYTKLSTPKEKLAEQMGWVNNFSAGQVKLIGLVEVLGAIGLVLPQLTGILPILTPLAAFGLALVMGVASRIHASREGEGMMSWMNYTLGVMAVVIAVGRFTGI